MRNGSDYRANLARRIGLTMKANLSAPSAPLQLTVDDSPTAREFADAFAGYGVEITVRTPAFVRLADLLDSTPTRKALSHFYADNYPAWTELTDAEADEIEARRVKKLRAMNEQYVAEAA